MGGEGNACTVQDNFCKKLHQISKNLSKLKTGQKNPWNPKTIPSKDPGLPGKKQLPIFYIISRERIFNQYI
jgi:hypothetical protein